MSWAMKRLHLIFLALVLWGDSNGFRVWNQTSVGDWQAGHSNATGNQNFHLATPVQPFVLPSRKGPNGDFGGEGNSSSVALTSEVQTAQSNPNFVQSSGGAVHGKPLLNSQAVPAVQPQGNLASQSSRLFWFVPLKPENCVNSHSRPVEVQYSSGFQRPSSSQSAAATNQASGFQTQSSYQHNLTTPGFVSQTPRYQDIPSFSQSVLTTSQISGIRNQSSEQASSPTRVSAGQSSPTSQGSHEAESSGPAKWYSILLGRIIPSYSHVSGSRSLSSYQASSPTQVSAGQSASTSQATSSGASTLSRWQAASGYNIPQYQSIPLAATNLISESQVQSSYQASSPTLSASTSQAHGSYGVEYSGPDEWYSVIQRQTIPPSQASGSQSQASYQPSTTTQDLADQSAIAQVQSLGDASLFPGQTSGSYTIIPSSSLVSGLETQSSYQASSPTLSASTSPAHGSYGVDNSGPDEWYSIIQGQTIPPSQASGSQSQASYQHNSTTPGFVRQTPRYQDIPSFSQSVLTTSQISGIRNQSSEQASSPTQVSAGQSSTSQATSSGVSTLSQWQAASGYNIPQYQSIPLAATNLISGSQAQSLYQPITTTQDSAGQSASTSQVPSSDASPLHQGQAPSMYNIPQYQSIPLSTQSVSATSPISGSQTQSSLQPSTTMPVSAGQSALAQAQSLGDASLFPSQTSGSYTIIPSSSLVSGLETQSLYQASSPPQVSAGQSASTSQVPSSGASTLPQSQAHSRYNISHYQGIPVANTNLISGPQTQSSYQPNTIAPDSVSQTASTSLAQSSGTSTIYQGLTSSRYLSSQHQDFPTSSQSVLITNQISGICNKSSDQASSPTPVSAGQSASTSRVTSSGSSTLSQWEAASGDNIPQYQSIPLAATNLISESQAQSSYQASSPTLSASTSQAHGSYWVGTSGPNKWYSIIQGQPIPPSQASGSQSQASYKPNTATSPSSILSSGASALNQGPAFGRYLTSQGQSDPSSSQSAVTTIRNSGLPDQTFQPSTTQALLGQSVSTSPAQGGHQAAQWHILNPSGFQTPEYASFSISQL